MKNIKTVAVLLIAAFLVGCAGSEPTAAPVVTEAPNPVVTEAPNPVAPEAPEPEVPIEMPVEEAAAIPAAVSVDELLQNGETQSISPDNYFDCINLLRDLGFVELHATIMGSDMYLPGNLTYNNDAFKLEFQFKDWSSDRFNNWTIYGTKADCLSDVSGLAFSEFDHLYEFPVWVLTDKVGHLDDCPQYFEYHLANFGEAGEAYPLSDWSLNQWDWGLYDESQLVSDFAQYMALYSPGSGNIYNVVSSFTEPGSYYLGDCQKFFFWEPLEAVQQVWEHSGLEKIVLRHPDDISFKNEGMEDCLYFEKGMTFSQWCDSEYNLDNWKFIDHGGYGEIRSQNDEYCLLVNYTLNSDGIAVESKMDVLLEAGFQTAVSISRVQ